MEDRRIAFRVGINIGDVIVEPHDIFGDGVNTAARLESIAEPGGICISSSAYDQVRGKVGVEFDDLGEQHLKNIARPVRTYAVVWDQPGKTTQAKRARPSPVSPPHLSIVVLPFTNLSGNPDQDYFVDGVTESLTTDLSRISGSVVIGRHTAFTYKGKAIDLKQVGRELNVRYALEGSVQRGGNRLRVNVQLIDAETGAHLWADRFDKPIADLFDMQDEIVSRLANTLDTQFIAGRGASSATFGSILTRWTCIFRASLACTKRLPSNTWRKRASFSNRPWRSIPVVSKHWLAPRWSNLTVGVLFFTDDRATHFLAAEAILIKLLALAPQYASAKLLLGVAHIFTDRAAQGISECEQALLLDRNLANAHGWIAIGKYFLGRAEDTEAHVQEALRLSPAISSPTAG